MSKNETNPLISIVIPVHNEARWLPGCIDSFLLNSYKNIEIIIVDDGSIDNSFEVAQEYRFHKNIRIVHFEQVRGEGAARNAGIKNAKGDFIIQTDADAIYPADFIEKSLKCFENNKDLSALSIGYLEVHPDQLGYIADYYRLKRKASYLVRSAGNKSEVGSFYMYKKNVPEAVNMYDEKLQGGTDLDFGLKVRAAGFKYDWAKDIYFIHADPARLFIFLKRTFNQSVFWKKVYKRWGMHPKSPKSIIFFLENLFSSLLPLYIILGIFVSPLWFVLALVAFSIEGIVPLFSDKESRLMLNLALKNKQILLAIILPMILFLRIRTSNYGKLYSLLFPKRIEKEVTFDV